MDRIDLYLHRNINNYYVNTTDEEDRVNKFIDLYTLSKSAHDAHEQVKPANLNKWRKAYLGTLNALDINTGEESKRKSRQLKKIVYETIESKIDNSIPMPKMVPRYKTDSYLVERTENYLKYEIDNIITKDVNDRSERATYIDGTCWYKVSWNSLSNSHCRSGDVHIEYRLADEIIPQPGIKNYKDLEYIFERQNLSISKLYDLYGRYILPLTDSDQVPVIACYYLNKDRVVGLFMWAEHSRQVICDEEDWQIRKLRTCKKCGEVVPQADVCPVCGNTTFKYKNAEKEILDEAIMEIYNPYESGETDDKSQDKYETRVFLEAGTEIPYYKVRQLPFVPRPAISSTDCLYGISEVWVTLDEQDMANKLYTKAADKVLKSGTLLTKPKKRKLGDDDNTLKVLGIDTAEEATMIQSKPIASDISQDITLASIMYQNARDASGITDSFQGKVDNTATSGKAKQYAAAQSAGRIESLRVMKAAAFAGLYELVLKYLLAFSDEERVFTSILPDGEETEMLWNKYMFLAKDKYGDIYYRDDIKFSTDAAATLSQDRVSMWQEISDNFMKGTLGDPSSDRTRELYWNMLGQLQYPLSKIAVAGIKENSQHLPTEVEQALLQDQEALQAAMQIIQSKQEGRGGARPNSGPEGNGATKAANIERTNERNRAANRQTTPLSAQQQVQAAGGE